MGDRRRPDKVKKVKEEIKRFFKNRFKEK